MGQKTNPIGNRLGIIRGWESNWFGGRDYADKVVEDEKNPYVPPSSCCQRRNCPNHYRTYAEAYHGYHSYLSPGYHYW